MQDASGKTVAIVDWLFSTVLRSLGAFFGYWKPSEHRFTPPRPPTISSAEPLARFLTQSGHFVASRNRVKPGAFLPAPNGQTSLFRIADLNEAGIWGIAVKHVESGHSPRHVCARAETTRDHIEVIGLRVHPDEPPPRHANITDWPLGKDDQKELALLLASRATLKLR